MKLDQPDFHEGELYIKLHVAAMAHLHMAKHFPDRIKKKTDGSLFEFDKTDLTMDQLVKAAEKIASTSLLSGVEVAEQHGADVADSEEWDTLYLHGISLLRHALIYTEVRHAVKHGDPGRMKAMFPYLIPIFKATGKHKYANEMLEVMYRWKNEWSDELKGVMLGHTLVNESGRPDGWIGIDLWQEHDVRLHKVDFPVSEVRGSADINLHQYISGILHTLRSAKEELWKRLGIKNADSKAKDLRTPHHILNLARDWHHKHILTWTVNRKSPVFESFAGELKGTDNGAGDRNEENKKKKSVFQPDALEAGVELLSDGSKSVEAFLARRDDAWLKGSAPQNTANTNAEPGNEPVEEDEEEEEEEEVVPTYEVVV
jgi:hypothetical protein